jgi:hypothetical protein
MSAMLRLFPQATRSHNAPSFGFGRQSAVNFFKMVVPRGNAPRSAVTQMDHLTMGLDSNARLAIEMLAGVAARKNDCARFLAVAVKLDSCGPTSGVAFAR